MPGSDPPGAYPAGYAGSSYPGAYPAGYGGAGYPGTYPPGQSAPGTAIPTRTNGLAVASLVCSIVGIVAVTAVVGVIFGFVARAQIRSAGGTQRGAGLALAGIIVGLCWLGLFVVQIIVAAAHSNGSNGTVTLPALAAVAGIFHPIG